VRWRFRSGGKISVFLYTIKLRSLVQIHIDLVSLNLTVREADEFARWYPAIEDINLSDIFIRLVGSLVDASLSFGSLAILGREIMPRLKLFEAYFVCAAFYVANQPLYTLNSSTKWRRLRKISIWFWFQPAPFVTGCSKLPSSSRPLLRLFCKKVNQGCVLLNFPLIPCPSDNNTIFVEGKRNVF